MNGNICKKTILKSASISILAVLFYTSCDDNGVKVVTPEVRTFTDKRDGKMYKEVTIGEQRWMAENLKYEADGSKCYAGRNDSVTALMCDVYGRLYDWNTAMNGELSSNAAPSGVEAVCPVGWHIPSDAEWMTLVDFVGTNSATKLKSREWVNGGTGAGGVRILDGTDKYRFSALDGPMASIWWSATERESNEGSAWTREIPSYMNDVAKVDRDKHTAYSVRCVHD